MKIGIIVPIIGNFGRKGFYHSQEIGLGKAIANCGHEVTVYKCVSKKCISNLQIEKNDGITIKYIPTRSIGVHGIFDTNLIEKDTSIVFVFADTQLIVPKIYKYCLKRKIKFIPYVGIAHSFKDNFKARIMDFVFKHYVIKVYKKVNVITKTIDAKEELKELGVKNCYVAPVGIDFDEMEKDYESKNRNALRKEFGFKPEDKILSFIARLQPEKHPLELIDIFMKIQSNNKKLIIVGKGELNEKINQKIKTLGIENSIKLIPEIPYNEIWKIHYISDYFLNLRKEEIFGMAIMEAVYYKSCVLAIKAPGPNTILRDMKGHYLCNDFDDIIKIANEKEINVLDLNYSKNKLESDFLWEKCIKYIFKIFNDEV